VIVPAGGSAKDMAKGLAIARNYMTKDGIVGLFIEDIEKMAQQDRSLALDNLDGSISKSDRILIMMTTNFPDLVDPAFLRQGRVDDYIEVGLPDVDAFTRLIQMRLVGRLDDDVDFARAFGAYHDYTPAWIVGGMSKVIRSVIARTHSADDIRVTTEDLITGATLMRRQWELQSAAANREPAVPTLDQAFEQSYRKWTDGESERPAIDMDEVESRVDTVVESRIDGATVNLQTETGKPVTGQINTN
jgi:SpoVK/Ycf46/Vps4 family AAA+-type ATPase